jgi:hypothetical protein
VLRPPTFEQLTRVLTDKPGHYHVLHFDGHGTFPRAAATRRGSTPRRARRAGCPSRVRTTSRASSPAPSWAACWPTRASPPWSSTPASRG